MFCKHCGKRIPEDSKFCPECGQSLTDKANPNTGQWEHCEIHFETSINLMGRYFHFFAEAAGPKGVYILGTSKKVWRGPFDHLPSGTNKGYVQAHQELLNQLLRDGWEVTGRNIT